MDSDPDTKSLLEHDAAGLPVEVTPLYPHESLTEPGKTVHGCILGKGRVAKAYVSQELYDALQVVRATKVGRTTLL